MISVISHTLLEHHQLPSEYAIEVVMTGPVAYQFTQNFFLLQFAQNSLLPTLMNIAVSSIVLTSPVFKGVGFHTEAYLYNSDVICTAGICFAFSTRIFFPFHYVILHFFLPGIS